MNQPSEDEAAAAHNLYRFEDNVFECEMEEVVTAVIAEAISISNEAVYPIVCTVDENGAPRARPITIFSSSVGQRVSNINEIYFNSRYKARKTAQILKNNNVCITFSVPHRHSYVSFRGLGGYVYS